MTEREQKKERLSAEYPIGCEVYSLYGDTTYTVESYDDDLKGLTCVRTYRATGIRYVEFDGKPAGPYDNEETTERVYYELEGLSDRLIPTSQRKRMRDAQLKVYGE